MRGCVCTWNLYRHTKIFFCVRASESVCLCVSVGVSTPSLPSPTHIVFDSVQQPGLPLLNYIHTEKSAAHCIASHFNKMANNPLFLSLLLSFYLSLPPSLDRTLRVRLMTVPVVRRIVRKGRSSHLTEQWEGRRQERANKKRKWREGGWKESGWESKGVQRSVISIMLCFILLLCTLTHCKSHPHSCPVHLVLYKNSLFYITLKSWSHVLQWWWKTCLQGS